MRLQSTIQACACPLSLFMLCNAELYPLFWFNTFFSSGKCYYEQFAIASEVSGGLADQNTVEHFGWFRPSFQTPLNIRGWPLTLKMSGGRRALSVKRITGVRVNHHRSSSWGQCKMSSKKLLTNQLQYVCHSTLLRSPRTATTSLVCD